jgi:hypothetical protein
MTENNCESFRKAKSQPNISRTQFIITEGIHFYVAPDGTAIAFKLRIKM